MVVVQADVFGAIPLEAVSVGFAVIAQFVLHRLR
jgi:hypothetical protein